MTDSGIPTEIAGEEIPIEARIVSACDAFSAMTTDGSYRPALLVQEAVEELHRCSGTQFDPAVVTALDALVGNAAVRRRALYATAQDRGEST